MDIYQTSFSGVAKFNCYNDVPNEESRIKINFEEKPIILNQSKSIQHIGLKVRDFRYLDLKYPNSINE